MGKKNGAEIKINKEKKEKKNGDNEGVKKDCKKYTKKKWRKGEE